MVNLLSLCNPLDPTCIPGAIAGGLANSAVEGLADALREGSKFIIKTSVGWWLNVPSVDLQGGGAQALRGQLRWLALVVAMAGVLWGGLRMAIRRNSEPAWEVGTGIARIAAVSSLGFIVPQLLLQAGDEFSVWVLDAATSNQVADRLTAVAALGGVTAPGAVILGAILMIVAGVVQAMLMFFREGGIIILTGVLVLSAAGGMNSMSKSWFPKVSGWLLALILYKPMAALVYAAALNQIGASDDPRNFLVGLAMLVLAIAALPAMMKLFSWAAPGAISSVSGMGGAAAAAGGAAAMGAMARRGGGGGGGGGGDDSGSPQGQAARVTKGLGDPGGGGGGGGTAATGAAPTAGTSAAGGASGGAAAGGAGAAGAAGAAVPVAGAVMAAAQAARQAAQVAKDTAAGAMTGGGEDG